MRKAQVARKTKETDISLSLDLDGSGKSKIGTGVGFFDHMLTLLASHALFDLEIAARGDLQVDAHHTVEDIGITLGQALDQAVGGKEGIQRFGESRTPMGESLAETALDLCGRPFLAFDARFVSEKTGEYENALTEEFLQAFVTNAKATLHVRVPYGKNDHHINEAVFKGLARALRQAVAPDPRRKGVPSTKGIL